MKLVTNFGVGAVAVSTTTFIVVNKCDYTVWSGILSNAGIATTPKL